MPLFKPQNQAPAQKAVLGTPLTGGKALQEKRTERIRQKNNAKSYTFLFIGVAFLVAYSVTFLIPQVTLFLNSERELAKLTNEINRYEAVVIPSLEDERDQLKGVYDAEVSEAEAVIDTIFPGDVDRIGITKRLENFATSINAIDPPFELNSLSFGDPEQEQGFTLLPISLSTSSSRENFNRFLQLINMSGLENADIPIRLMEVSNITIRYKGADPKTGEDLGVDFSVKLNAYSR